MFKDILKKEVENLKETRSFSNRVLYCFKSEKHEDGSIKRKRLAIKNIIEILREADSGVSVKSVCCKHDISRQTFYNWRNKFYGMKISDAIKLKALEKENRKLKRMLAEVSLDNHVLKDILKNKNLLTPQVRKKTLTKLVYCMGLSNRHSRRILNLNHRTFKDAPEKEAGFNIKKNKGKRWSPTDLVWQSNEVPSA